MNILKLISLVIALMFTYSIFAKLYLLGIAIRYEKKRDGITASHILLWAIATSTFIFLQFLL